MVGLPIKPDQNNDSVTTSIPRTASLSVVSYDDGCPYAAQIVIDGCKERSFTTISTTADPVIWALNETANRYGTGLELAVYYSCFLKRLDPTRRDAEEPFFSVTYQRLAEEFNPASDALADLEWSS